MTINVGFLLMVCSFRVERLRDCSRCEPERRRIRTAGKPSTEGQNRKIVCASSAQRSLSNLGASATAAPAYRSHRSGCNGAEPVQGITKGTRREQPASPGVRSAAKATKDADRAVDAA